MKVIMWDVDDVLNDLMGEWFRLGWLPSHPECQVKYADFFDNPPHEVLGVVKQEYLDSLDAFRLEHFKKMKPIPEMMEWFHRYGNKATHVVVTSVPLNSAHLSAEWVFSHFGQWIHSFNIVPSCRKGDAPFEGPKTKVEFIKNFSRIDIVVEDNPETIASMESLGICTVTIPRPWNKNTCSLIESLNGLTNLLH